MGQMVFFDIVNRYAGLDAKNAPLVKIDSIVRWEDFRVRLEAAWRKPAGELASNAGCKPRDAVAMFKAMVPCALYSPSDDRLSFAQYDASGTPIASSPTASAPSRGPTIPPSPRRSRTSWASI